MSKLSRLKRIAVSLTLEQIRPLHTKPPPPIRCKGIHVFNHAARLGMFRRLAFCQGGGMRITRTWL